MRKSATEFKLSDTNIMSSGQAAKTLGVSVRTIAKWLDSGIVHSWKINKERRIFREELVRLAEMKGLPVLIDKNEGSKWSMAVNNPDLIEENESLSKKIEMMQKVIESAEKCLSGGKFICAENCYKVDKDSRHAFFDTLRSIKSFYVSKVS